MAADGTAAGPRRYHADRVRAERRHLSLHRCEWCADHPERHALSQRQQAGTAGDGGRAVRTDAAFRRATDARAEAGRGDRAGTGPDGGAPPEAAPETVIADADRLPPPWLYECRTFNDDTYLSDNGNPPPRCVTLTTTGLSGMIESRNTSACEMKNDRCQRVPDGALCDGWRKRLLEAESALRFGVTENRARDEAEVQRLTRIVLESTCGKS